MIIGNVLFLEESLDRYLRAQEGAVDNHVRQKVSRVDLIKSDAEIVHALLPDARVAPLKVDFDNPQKDVQEARVRVHDMFDGMVEIDGVRATRSFAFTGDPGLFRLRTNPYSTTLPHGEISIRRVIIGMSGRNDAETLKREIDRQEQLLREYVETSTKQIEVHNDKLGALLGEAVASRRQQLASLEDLKNRI